jgi:hypothetical protein
MDYVIANAAYDLLDRKANVTAVTEFIKENNAPPGVNFSPRTSSACADQGEKRMAIKQLPKILVPSRRCSVLNRMTIALDLASRPATDLAYGARSGLLLVAAKSRTFLMRADGDGPRNSIEVAILEFVAVRLEGLVRERLRRRFDQFAGLLLGQQHRTGCCIAQEAA